MDLLFISHFQMHPLFEALLAVKQLHPKMENKIQYPWNKITQLIRSTKWDYDNNGKSQ